MANSVAAHTFGEDYQYTLFWHHVCRLLMPNSKVKQVLIEASDAKSFDDIIVIYDSQIPDANDTYYQNELFQIKFHMTSNGAITTDDLIDPKFINASTVSFLQRLRDVQNKYSPDNSRFILSSPWMIDPNDALAKLHENTDGHLRLDVLFDSGIRSEMSLIRKKWFSHLGLKCEDDLKPILKSLRINTNASLKTIRECLSDRLYRAGLKPIEDGQRINPYEDLARKLIEARETSFTKERVIEICRDEKLINDKKSYLLTSNGIPVAIRSYKRWAESLDDLPNLLCLCKYFEGRRLIKGNWEEIKNILSEYISAHIKPDTKYEMHLPLHTSLAFFVGRMIPEKMGAEIGIYQKSSGYKPWFRLKKNATGTDQLNSTCEVLNDSVCNVFVSVSISQGIENDVISFIKERKFDIGKTIKISMSSISQNSISDADESFTVANQIHCFLKENITKNDKIHIFMAVPNVVAFHLGQVMYLMNNITLYEFSQDQERSYFETITL